MMLAACSSSARERRPDFIPTPEADSTIAELCDRLDRLPLAIEIAAARVSVMSTEEILAGLETRFGLLGSDARLAPSRHRTVRAAAEWSYELLDPAEREALRSLSVLVGSFDADAGIEVLGPPLAQPHATARAGVRAPTREGAFPRAEGSDVRRITHKHVADLDPDWQPLP
jgi:predicted ATPase